MKRELPLLIFSFLLSGLFYEIFADNNVSALIKVVGDSPATFDSVSAKPSDVDVSTVLAGLIEMCDKETDRFSVNHAVVSPANVSLSALDFLLDSYGSADYYETGNWLSAIISRSPMFSNEFPDNLSISHRPVKGRVTSKIGYRSNYHRMHLGMDFSAEVGDTVVAVIDGVVKRIGYEKGGYGLFVCICNSCGVETRYAHLFKPLIKEGDSVQAGDPLALAGTTGRSTGPHLHFEIRYNGKIVDPALFFQ